MAEITIRFDVRFTPRVFRFGLAGLLVSALAAELASENLTLTTYYPAPSGVYTNMLTTGNTFLARDGGLVQIGPTAATQKVSISGGGLLVNGGKVVAGNGTNSGVTSGVWFWSEGDSNHVIYSAASSGGVNPAGGATAGSVLGAGQHRLRFRTATGQGWLFENNANQTRIDFDSDTGDAYFNGFVQSNSYGRFNGAGYFSGNISAGMGFVTPQATVDAGPAGANTGVVAARQNGCTPTAYGLGTTNCPANTYATNASGIYVSRWQGSSSEDSTGVMLCCPRPGGVIF